MTGETHGAGRVDAASRWMYRGLWSALVQWFRVPDQPPTLPVTAGEDSMSFQPADGFLKYLKLWFWIVAVVIDLGILAAWIVIVAVEWWVGLLLAPVALVIGIVPDIIGYIAVHLRFDTTWYVMTQRAVRIRRGVWVIHETTITYDNVQNVKLTQGPIQRMFGIASVLIETAGAGGTPKQQHGVSVSNQGLIEGIANAAHVRDQIMARARLSHTTGLGDEPIDAVRSSAAPQWTTEHLATLRDIRDAVARLGMQRS